MKQRCDSEHSRSCDRNHFGAEEVHPPTSERTDDQTDNAERSHYYPKLPVGAATLNDVQWNESEHGRVRREDAVGNDQIENIIPSPKSRGGRVGGQVKGPWRVPRNGVWSTQAGGGYGTVWYFCSGSQMSS